MQAVGGRGRRLVAGVALAVVAVIVLVLLLSGSGSPAQPLSYQVHEVKRPCIAGSYLPKPAAHALLRQPPPKNWSSVQDDPRARFANSVTVGVTIRGGDTARITLEGIHFQVEHSKRPPGLTLYRPCLFQAKGHVLEAALDSTPPDLSGSVSFPWSVSLDKPLNLYLVARSLKCHCRWTATIPWKSGGRRGSFVISEAGKPFKVTFSGGMNAYVAGKGGWERL